jgi:glycine/D-amino acid oxidase-like deaminating enzyme
MATAEAVIVGGGVMGSSILYNLAVRGVTDTILLEQNALASGSTSKSQAILRMHYSNEVTTRMAWESLRVFKEFEEITGGPSGYVRTGYVLIAGESDRGALEKNVALGRRLGVDTKVVSAADVREIAPVMSVRDDEAFAYEPESGYADTYTVTTGYARRARELGAQVRVETTVTGIEVTGERVTAVVTADERIETPIAVVATGPWSKPFLASVGVDVPLSTVRHQVLMLRRPEDRVPEHPAVADLVNDFSARPDAGHLTLMGVGEAESVGPDEYNQGVDMPVVETYFGRMANRIPEMAHALFRGGWSGLFTTTPDWHPILDRVPGIEGLYCAVGFSGHGFKLSPMIGVAMAELITEGRGTTIDISMLGLGRFEKGDLLGSSYGMAVLA